MIEKNLESVVEEQKDEIERLEEDLEQAYEDIIGLTPDAMRNILYEHYKINTRQGLDRWLNQTVDQIVKCSEPFSESCFPGGGKEVYCPLCGRGVKHTTFRNGFSYPEGLKRHLTGLGNANLCTAMNAVKKLANARLKGKTNLKSGQDTGCI